MTLTTLTKETEHIMTLPTLIKVTENMTLTMQNKVIEHIMTLTNLTKVTNI